MRGGQDTGGAWWSRGEPEGRGVRRCARGRATTAQILDFVRRQEQGWSLAWRGQMSSLLSNKYESIGWDFSLHRGLNVISRGWKVKECGSLSLMSNTVYRWSACGGAFGRFSCEIRERWRWMLERVRTGAPLAHTSYLPPASGIQSGQGQGDSEGGAHRW